MCKESNDAVSNTPIYAQYRLLSIYLKRRNNVAVTMYKNICQHCGIKTNKMPWKHHSEPVTENKEVKVLWDFEVRADKVIPAWRADIDVVYKTKRTTTATHIAVALDWEVDGKEDENILKYQYLRIEIQKLWNTEAIPVIMGSLGASSINFEKHLREIPGNHNSTKLIKSAQLGSSDILRRVLDLYGIW